MAQSIYFQGSYGKKKYDVDIVFCIDATGSMNHVIDMVKKNIQRLPNDIIQKALEGKNGQKKIIDNLRLRAIIFRDYQYDGEHAMEATDFFKVPEQQELFNRVVNGIVVEGGGDEPENGLEALAYAMASEWKKPDQERKCRQIIVVLTDASTLPLGEEKRIVSPYYDPKMPSQFETLSSWWGDGPDDTNAKMDFHSKRLLLFAPDAQWWTTIHQNWENVIHTKTVAGQGLKEQDYDKVIELLVNSI